MLIISKYVKRLINIIQLFFYNIIKIINNQQLLQKLFFVINHIIFFFYDIKTIIIYFQLIRHKIIICDIIIWIFINF